MDAVLVHDVSDEASHRDAAVLHLSVAQPPNRRLVGLLPELTLGQVERVVVALSNGGREVLEARVRKPTPT